MQIGRSKMERYLNWPLIFSYTGERKHSIALVDLKGRLCGWANKSVINY